jgi:signal peptidase I
MTTKKPADAERDAEDVIAAASNTVAADAAAEATEARDSAPASGGAASPSARTPRDRFFIPELAGNSSTGRSSLRLLRGIVLYFVLPVVLTVVASRALTPPSGVEASGPLAFLQNWVRDQPVPLAIAFFMLFASAFWFARHRLPFASAVYPKLPDGAARDLGPAFERGRALVEECRAIVNAPKLAVKDPLREELATAATQLVASMQDAPFVEKGFADALTKVNELLASKLDKHRKGEFREIIESVVIAISFALILRTFAFEPFKIPSSSMVPTLMVGDHIFVNKASYGLMLPGVQKRLFAQMPPTRGDVMVFKFPERPAEDFIKRVIALPGDTLEAKNGHPWINGWEVPSCFAGVFNYGDVDTGSGIPPAKHEADLFVEFLGQEAFFTIYDHAAGAFPESQGPFVVPAGEVMVMGDNRRNSHDSRFWNAGQGGGVPFDNIKGRANIVWLNLLDSSRMGAPVMGRGRLPAAQGELKAGVEKCYRDRPALDKTTPPAAK